MKSYYDFVRAHPESVRQFSCKDLLFLKMDCPPDFTRAEEWLELNCFLHVLAGTKLVYSREHSWKIQKGDTIFLKKGAFTIERLSTEPFCALLFYVPDDYIRSFVQEHGSLFSPSECSAATGENAILIHMTPLMTAYYASVIPYFTTRAEPADDLLELKFRELLLNIITCKKNPVMVSYFYKLFQDGTDDLQEVMESNCFYNLHLHDYARLCHRSLSSYKRDFYTVFRTAPGRWLLHKRLERACHLLLHSSKPVSEVVVESGFVNMTHFDRVFKKHFNISPLQYRKQASVLTA